MKDMKVGMKRSIKLQEALEGKRSNLESLVGSSTYQINRSSSTTDFPLEEQVANQEAGLEMDSRTSFPKLHMTQPPKASLNVNAYVYARNLFFGRTSETPGSVWLRTSRDLDHTRCADILINGLGRDKRHHHDITLCPAILGESRHPVGVAVLAAETHKLHSNGPKCQELGWSCISLAVETYGKEGHDTISRLAYHLDIHQSSSMSSHVAEIYGQLNIIRFIARAIITRNPNCFCLCFKALAVTAHEASSDRMASFFVTLDEKACHALPAPCHLLRSSSASMGSSSTVEQQKPASTRPMTPNAVSWATQLAIGSAESQSRLVFEVFSRLNVTLRRSIARAILSRTLVT
eukprot:Em0001g3072a